MILEASTVGDKIRVFITASVVIGALLWLLWVGVIHGIGGSGSGNACYQTVTDYRTAHTWQGHKPTFVDQWRMYVKTQICDNDTNQ